MHEFYNTRFCFALKHCKALSSRYKLQGVLQNIMLIHVFRLNSIVHCLITSLTDPVTNTCKLEYCRRLILVNNHRMTHLSFLTVFYRQLPTA